MANDKAKTIIDIISEIDLTQPLPVGTRKALKARLDAVDRLEHELFECRRVLEHAIAAIDFAGNDAPVGLKARMQTMVADLNFT